MRQYYFGRAALVAAATAAFAGSAFAGPMVTLNQGPFSFANGGEFVGTPIDFPATPVSLTNDGNFQTFCIQTQVDFTPGTTYNVYFSNVGAPGGPALTEGAAYLYNLFINGALPAYDYPNASNLRQTDAGALQVAIWTLEGQDVSGQAPSPDPALTNAYLSLAAANAAPGNFYGVSIMVMYFGDETNPTFTQNQLVELVPAPGATGLAGIGGAILLRRRRR